MLPYGITIAKNRNKGLDACLETKMGEKLHNGCLGEIIDFKKLISEKGLQL